MAGSGWLALRTMPGPGWVRGSGPAVLRRLRDAAVVRPGFLSAAEEETLRRELDPELRRRRYEFDHWDAAIHGFRETEKSRWSEASRAILQRVQTAAFGPGQTLLSSVHVLDLEPRGYIKPHVDSIKFCGSTIAGLSLLSPSVMRLVHTQEPGEWLELLLEPCSLYILRDSARYDFSHEILRDEESFFGELRVPRGRRISVICRSLPEELLRDSGPAVLRRLWDAAVVWLSFLSAAEGETLRRELEPQLRCHRYEFDHWDAVRRPLFVNKARKRTR